MTAPIPADTADTAAAHWTLQCDSFGKLILTTAQGVRVVGVVPIRAFPIQSHDVGIALVDLDGHEAAWIEHLDQVAEPAQQLIRQALATREFVPVIGTIVSVTSFSTPCTWAVETDRGSTTFVLRGDEDIRRIGTAGSLLVADSHGIQYLIRDQFVLDAHSKKILDRFL